MSKKKKIILSSVIVGVILLGIILTIILVNIKRFNIKSNSEFDFNKHTKIEVVDLNSSYTPYEDNYYNNGTQIIKNNSTNKLGLFSYFDNKVLADTDYNQIQVMYHNLDTNKTYFRLLDNSKQNYIQIVDENGLQLDFLDYDTETDTTYTNIKTKTIDVKKNKDKVKTKINNKYHNEKIKIKDAKLLGDGDKKYTYFSEGAYLYEIWQITTTDNITYMNLYKVENGKHVLIQTLNNELGVSLEKQNLDILFLIDGTPVFQNKRVVSYDGINETEEYEFYDINFNLKGKANLSSRILEQRLSFFRLGDYYLVQTISTANEKKYDYYITSDDGITTYFDLKTFKISLKNGDISESNFNYLIIGSTHTFNDQTVLVNTYKIQDKQLGSATNLLINERLQSKKINYSFNHIIKVNKNRYITCTIDSSNNKPNYNLIDQNYNLITHLDNFENVFATNDSLMVQDEETNVTYICNHDGIVIKKMSSDNFTYLKDKDYYLRTEETKVGTDTIENYYLERLGLSNANPLYSYNTNTNTYTYGEKEYLNIKLIANDYVTLLFCIEKVDGTYTYNIYNLGGEKLATLEGLENEGLLNLETSQKALFADDNQLLFKVGRQFFVANR